MISATPIIAQERTPVNSHQRRRFDAQDRVRHSVSLSAVARLVYAELDSMCATKESCWPKQTTLAAYLGFSVRSIIRSLHELEQHGFIRMQRKPRFIEYSMTYGDVQNCHITEPVMLPSCTSDVQNCHITSAVSINEPTKEPIRRVGETAAVAENPPARLETASDELARNLRACGYQPDPPLIRRLAALIPEGCTVPVAVAVLRRRISRPRSKPLKQAMLPIFFTEDVPAKWQAEARELEVRQQIERARHPVIDEAAERRQAQEILRRPDSDRIELEWAHMVLDGGGMAATA